MVQLRCNTAELRGGLHFNHALSRLNSWRVGGSSDCFYAPSDVEDLSFFLKRCVGDESVTCLGLGSNVLVRDGGVRGIVISMRGALVNIQQTAEQQVRAEAGVTCSRLARYCASRGLEGLEFLASVPGTVGGALAMNAGAFGGEIWERVQTAETINRRGEIYRRYPDEFNVAYRSVTMSREEWFIAGHFALKAGKQPGELKHRIREHLRKRGESQPLGVLNCGSVFKNPPGTYAARLIEQCELKACAVGDAQVSSKHANFIVNRGNATADDIEALIKRIQDVVAANTGIRLEPEVRIIGVR